MKFSSFEHFDISVIKMLGVALAASAGAAAATGVAVGDVLGAGKPATLIVVALLVFYIVVSTPRRVLDAQRVVQARESILLLTAAKACLGVTGSRARTLIELRSRDAVVADSLRESARMILLGARVERAVEQASRNLVSYSAAAALRGAATLHSTALDVNDEENRGLSGSSELSRETKLPMFMTVCFFAPIMLLLFAVFSHSYGFESLVELGAFEFVAIDLAFYLASGENGPR
jgi:hypothetical protein